MKIFVSLLLCCLLLAGCGTAATTPETQQATIPAATGNPEALNPPVPASLWGRVQQHTFQMTDAETGLEIQLSVDDQGAFSGQYVLFPAENAGKANGPARMPTLFYGNFSEPQLDGPGAYLFRVDYISFSFPQDLSSEDAAERGHSLASRLEEDVCLLYLPGKSVSEVPVPARVGLSVPEQNSQRLYSYVLSAMQEKIVLCSDPAPLQVITENLLQLTEEESAFLEAGAHLPDTDQSDINLTAQAVFECWSRALSDLWSLAKDNLDGKTLQTMTAEQQQWQLDREAAAKDSAKEAEGKDSYPAIYYGTCTDLTRQRVYTLAEALSRK